MVGKGRIVLIQDNMYEVVRILKLRPGAVLPTESANEIKEAWHAEKVFKHGDEYYFVNEVQVVEPIEDEQDRNTGEAAVDSTEDTTGGQMDLGGGDGDQEEHN
jgi:Mg2+/Co2+ transporter CorB